MHFVFFIILFEIMWDSLYINGKKPYHSAFILLLYRYSRKRGYLLDMQFELLIFEKHLEHLNIKTPNKVLGILEQV